MKELRALIVDTPHIDHILSGEKIWEMRSEKTLIRGTIGLIKVGHPRKVIGVVKIIDSLGPFSEEQMLANQPKHLMTPERINDPKTSQYRHAWVLENAKILKQPISCKQTSQVKWVILDEETSAAVMKAID